MLFTEGCYHRRSGVASMQAQDVGPIVMYPLLAVTTHVAGMGKVERAFGHLASQSQKLSSLSRLS